MAMYCHNQESKHESQIILFPGAERMLNRMGIDPHTLDLKKLHSQNIPFY